MSTTTIPESGISDPGAFRDNEFAQYRSLSVGAVMSLILGVISFPALFIAGLLFLPVLGLLSGLLALRRISRAPDEYSGKGLAVAGGALSLLWLLGGAATATVVYVNEVPEGHRRLKFAELKPYGDEANQQVPSAILKLDGQRVFVKGYVLSDERTADLKSFILVPDMGTCCFGGQPKLSDMIEVVLKDPLRVRYSWQRRKLAGVLTVDPRPKRENGLDGGHYKLVADYVY